MNSANGPYFVASLMCLVLAASALIARRPAAGQTIKMAAAWVAIFTIGFGIFAFRNEFSAIGQRMKSELLGTPAEQGGEIRIPMAEDGHFWTTATVNGRKAHFLIDSGATNTTISSEFAGDLGVPQDQNQIIVDTANGSVAMGSLRADLKVASIERPDMRLLVNPADGTNVIGMNFLSSLTS